MNILSSLLNFIANKIGNVSMGTSATTLTGAIAEHETQINSLATRMTAAESIALVQVTDCNVAVDPRLYYYTNGDASNLNRPEPGWCIIRCLFLNGNPRVTTAYSLCQIGMPMNSNTAKLYVRTRNTSAQWSAWRTITLA